MDFTTTEVWRMFFAALLGGIIIGYLLTSKTNSMLLDRAREHLAEDATLIESLVTKNDAANQEIIRHRAAKYRLYGRLFDMSTEIIRLNEELNTYKVVSNALEPGPH